MIITREQCNEIYEKTSLQENQADNEREKLRAQAMKVLYDNQECFVAQWILQNPFANPKDYTLRFVYHDQSMLGYDVQMVKNEGDSNV